MNKKSHAVVQQNKLEFNYRPGTSAHWCIAQDRHCVCIHQVVAFFCVKWRHGRHLESVTSNQNPILSIDAYLREERVCQILSRSDLKWRRIRLFGDGRPNKKNKKKHTKMSSILRPVPGLKNLLRKSVLGKILCKSILSTSTSNQPKKYLKYKYKYII